MARTYACFRLRSAGHGCGLRGSGKALGFSEHLEGDGPEIFRHACKLGLEGIASKRRDLPYKSGRCRSWVKIRNPAYAR
jgi:bifunctional non-homologous end joining protein LigD